jgi:hypothetical protein
VAQIQVIRRGAENWELTRVDEIWKGAHEYETIGRVRRDGALYYVDLPDWKEETFTWKRQPRGYLIPRAAFKFIIDECRKEKVTS